MPVSSRQCQNLPVCTVELTELLVNRTWWPFSAVLVRFIALVTPLSLNHHFGGTVRDHPVPLG